MWQVTVIIVFSRVFWWKCPGTRPDENIPHPPAFPPVEIFKEHCRRKTTNADIVSQVVNCFSGATSTKCRSRNIAPAFLASLKKEALQKAGFWSVCLDLCMWILWTQNPHNENAENDFLDSLRFIRCWLSRNQTLHRVGTHGCSLSWLARTTENPK